MRKLVFSFLVVFSSIVFGQSGFNPPKTKINEPLKVENIGLDTVYFANHSIILTIDNLKVQGLKLEDDLKQVLKLEQEL